MEDPGLKDRIMFISVIVNQSIKLIDACRLRYNLSCTEGRVIESSSSLIVYICVLLVFEFEDTASWL